MQFTVNVYVQQGVVDVLKKNKSEQLGICPL